ncbi:hypothetical protein RHA1_ro03564 [Rhodococcus jostii RHA1]|uniref:Uncharacterized protein n=1 Tax=Rhodococcus jostii (strain RHA1) TaxID=101510 RepID=Q0SAR9_RHOJR|nr:hypothetical protein RHA1_ro03564 [Rhodococcus jostii RHA1]
MAALRTSLSHWLERPGDLRHRLPTASETEPHPRSVPRAGLLVGLHSRHGSERGDQQTQQKQHIHLVPCCVSADLSGGPVGGRRRTWLRSSL